MLIAIPPRVMVKRRRRIGLFSEEMDRAIIDFDISCQKKQEENDASGGDGNNIMSWTEFHRMNSSLFKNVSAEQIRWRFRNLTKPRPPKAEGETKKSVGGRP